jgi:hypothetical protein
VNEGQENYKKGKRKGLKMAKNASNRHFKARTRDLVRQAALVSYGVELPDLYCGAGVDW